MSRRALVLLLGGALVALLLLAAAPSARCELDGFEPDDSDAAVEEDDDGFGASAAAAASAAREEEARAEALRRHQKQQQQQQQQHAAGASSSSAAAGGGGASASAKGPAAASGAAARGSKAAAGAPASKAAPGGPSKPSNASTSVGGVVVPKFFLEALMAVLLILYGLNFWVGKIKNERLALDWAQTFCSEGALMDRNFSLLGPGDTDEGEIMMKESHSIFKFYASGRRYCKGMLATMELRRRQDLLSYLMQFVLPKDDTLEVEIYMNDANVPPVVFAIGHTREVKTLAKDRRDLRNYAKLINLKDRIPKLDTGRFACYSESKEIAGDIVAQALDDVVSEAAWDAAGRYVQSVVVSSESSTGAHKKVINIMFKLPPPGQMGELEKALASIPSLIDAVGSYKVNSETKKRAEERRRKASEAELNSKQKKEEREELVAKKRAEKIAAEKERLARMNPEARAKAEEKQEALLRKRNSKFKVKLGK